MIDRATLRRMGRSALIVGDHRLELRRCWDESLPLLVVCMLNPSVADHKRDDPTILALIDFASRWGYGGLLVINLNSLRTSSPVEMMAAEHSQFDDRANERQWRIALDYAAHNGNRVLVAWGNDGVFRSRHLRFRAVAAEHRVELICLGLTSNLQPKHPMARGRHRIPRDQQPRPWPLTA